MKLALLHNHFDQAHLDTVVTAMRELGAPTIRCYDLGFDDLAQAIEGSHRLRACEILGIEPNLVWLDADTDLADLEDIDFEGDCRITKVGELGDIDNYAITIEG